MSDSAVKLQVRLDRQLKEDTDSALANMGLDATTAVRMFFKQIVRTQSIPFQVSGLTENGFTPEKEAEIMRAYEESFDPANLSKAYSSAEEMFDDIENGTVTYGAA